MADTDPIRTRVTADVSDFLRNIRAAIQSAKDLDQAIGAAGRTSFQQFNARMTDAVRQTNTRMSQMAQAARAVYSGAGLSPPPAGRGGLHNVAPPGGWPTMGPQTSLPLSGYPAARPGSLYVGPPTVHPGDWRVQQAARRQEQAWAAMAGVLNASSPSAGFDPRRPVYMPAANLTRMGRTPLLSAMGGPAYRQADTLANGFVRRPADIAPIPPRQVLSGPAAVAAPPDWLNRGGFGPDQPGRRIPAPPDGWGSWYRKGGWDFDPQSGSWRVGAWGGGRGGGGGGRGGGGRGGSGGGGPPALPPPPGGNWWDDWRDRMKGFGGSAGKFGSGLLGGLGTGAKYAGMGAMAGVNSVTGLGYHGLQGLGAGAMAVASQWKPGLMGGLAGAMSGSPVRGMMSGAMTGMFMGGPGGAAVGAVTGGLGGAITGGIGLLTEGLGKAVELSKELIAWTVQLGIEYQKNVAYFSAFTGGIESSRALMDKLQGVALASPFKFDQLTSASSLLLGYGVSPGATPGVVGRLAMTAGGDEGRLQRLSLAYAQVMSHGRFMGQELRQFAEAGIGAPDFAKTAGLTTGQFRERMSQGLIGPNVVIETLNRLTSAGGRFQEVNDAMLNTVGGRWNQFVEGIEIRLGKLGDRLFGKLGVSDVIGGIAGGMGPWLDDLTERMMPALEWVWKTGGYVFDPLVEAGKTLAEVGKDIWQSEFGKLLLPQTWEEATVAVLSFGGTVGMMVGTMLDSARGIGAFVQKVQMPMKVMEMSTKEALGLDVSTDRTQLANAMADVVAYESSPDKYSRMLSTPWQRAIKNFAQGKDPWEKFRGGAAEGVVPEAISIPIVIPEDTRKFLDDVRDSFRQGFSPLDEFAQELAKIRKSPLPFADQDRMLTSAGPLMGGLGIFGVNQDVAAMGLTPEQEAFANYRAYLKLRANYGAAPDTFRLPTGAMADTQEALRTVIESNNQAPSEDTQAEIRRILDEANAQRDKQLKELEELNRYLRENSIKLVKKPV